MCTFLHGGGECFHEGGDVGDSDGGGEGGADGGGVFAVEVAGYAGNVDEAAGGADEGEEGLGGCQGAVVVALEGLLDNVYVWREWRLVWLWEEK